MISMVCIKIGTFLGVVIESSSIAQVLNSCFFIDCDLIKNSMDATKLDL